MIHRVARRLAFGIGGAEAPCPGMASLFAQELGPVCSRHSSSGAGWGDGAWELD